MKKITIRQKTDKISEKWKNFALASVNDHVVRVSVLERDFHWHKHENSDELFLVLEGELWIDLKGASVLLAPGELFKVSKGTLHRTRAKGRCVNLTFEHKDTDVEGVSNPRSR